MEIHQKHRELGASHFGLANAMGNYMQQLEEEVRPLLSRLILHLLQFERGLNLLAG